MAMTKKQQHALEEAVNALITAEASTDPWRWIDRAKETLVGIIPERERSRDPKPYRHHAYPDRSSAPLSGYDFKPRPQYEQRGVYYPLQLAMAQPGPTITVRYDEDHS